nr:hypothetical protein B-114 - Trypanosoma brucei mitochondrion [Trypanosoma brucei]
MFIRLLLLRFLFNTNVRFLFYMINIRMFRFLYVYNVIDKYGILFYSILRILLYVFWYVVRAFFDYILNICCVHEFIHPIIWFFNSLLRMRIIRVILIFFNFIFLIPFFCIKIWF